MNIGIMLGTFLATSSAVAGRDARVAGGETSAWSNTTMGLWAFGMALGVLACFRSKHRVVIPLVLSVPALFLHLDTLPALVTMASALVWVRDVRLRILVWTAATISTIVAIFRATRGGPAGASFFNDVLSNSPTPQASSDMPMVQVLLLSGVIVAVFTGVGLLRRARRDKAHFQELSDVAVATSAQLKSQTADLLEREDIAREVHDVLGHRLSMISMQASMLQVEAEASNHPHLLSRATQIQQGAQGSMNDLRSLLSMLRQKTPSEHPASDINDLAALVDECADGGTSINSTIYVQDAQSLHPVVSRSVHRIVAELLTNVRKHAGQETAVLNVRGSADAGVTVTCSNRTDATTPSAPGTGSGLAGIQRRVESLNGTFTAEHLDAGSTFRVTIWVPWTPTPADARTASAS